ncbi:MAG: DUF2497 domain-containing protein [Rhodospirillaceae bacterium]
MVFVERTVMNQSKNDDEPSMEEILASIRKIISDDQSEAKNNNISPAAAKNTDKDLSLDGQSGTAESPEILELTEVVEESEPSVQEDVSQSIRVEEAELKDAGAIERSEASVLKVEQVSSAETSEIDPLQEEHLIDSGAMVAATASISNLAAVIEEGRDKTALGDANRTIEDLVKELLRPMVKDWLDNNLPNLVERLVRKEIERLTRNR